MPYLRELLANNMKTYRKARGLSQSKLAEKVNTAPNYIAMIESCKKFPSDKMLERIAGALGIKADLLFSTQINTDISLQISLLKDVYTEIYADITKLLNTRISKLEK